MNEWVSNTTHGSGCEWCARLHSLYAADWNGCGCEYCTGKGLYAEMLKRNFQEWADAGHPTQINGSIGIEATPPVCPTDVIVANEFGCQFDVSGKCYVKY